MLQSTGSPARVNHALTLLRWRNQRYARAGQIRSSGDVSAKKLVHAPSLAVRIQRFGLVCELNLERAVDL
jgi:hypothetical protein